MKEQKQEIITFVGEQRSPGRTIGETVHTLGVSRANFYRWKKGESTPSPRNRLSFLTPDEKAHINRIKSEKPHLRHRRIQGVLQSQEIYLSEASIYRHLRGRGEIEPYARQPSPLKKALYKVWQRNLVWGADWTKFRIAAIRWYLLALIDFFSRYLLAWDIVPSVHAGHIKALCATGLLSQNILSPASIKPDLRVDQGNPNTSGITKAFFELTGIELSFARFRRPTDNAITERFYGSIKQEEIYLVGDYFDEISARQEVGSYIRNYNEERPHQAI